MGKSGIQFNDPLTATGSTAPEANLVIASRLASGATIQRTLCSTAITVPPT